MIDVTITPEGPIDGTDIKIGRNRIVALAPTVKRLLPADERRIDAVSRYLQERFGCEMPDTGEAVDGEVTLLRIDPRRLLVLAIPGNALFQEMPDFSGIRPVDVSDFWCGLALTGADIDDRSAFIFDSPVFGQNSETRTVARSVFQGIPVIGHRRATDELHLFIPRSYAKTTVSRLTHSIELQMRRSA